MNCVEKSPFNRLQPAPFSTIQASRICIVKPSALGDVVQSLPVLAALRHRFPRAHIAWLVNRSYAPLLRPVSLLDEIIEFDREKYRGGGIGTVRSYLDFMASLAEHRFDLCIDLQGLLRSGSMAWATRATRRIGLASAREGANWFYSDIVDDLPIEQGAIDRYWRVVEALGAGHLPKEFPLQISRDERDWAADTLADLPRPIIGINPGSRWETKRWPAGHFAETYQSLAPQRKGGYLLVGGPGEESVAAAVESELDGQGLNLAGKTSLRQLAALLEQCDVVLTNDSGPMHLAAAVGTRTVAIFTCTSPVRAGAFGEGHRIAQTSVSCRASYIKKCDRMDCMHELTSDKVLPILNQALAASDAPSISCMYRRHAA
jgi:lipopolysaccharide heptosyltransferase I